MKLGKIDHLLLMGGTSRLLNMSAVAEELGFRATVLSAGRLLRESLGEKTLEDALRERKITFENVSDINAYELKNHVTKTTLGLSVGAPWIFRKHVIEVFEGRLLNAHPAKLPENRGGGGFSWQIMRGVNFGVQLIHIVDGGIDTGDIIFSEEFEFPPKCKKPKDYFEFHRNAEIPFFRIFLQHVQSMDEFYPIKQQEYFSTYFPRLNTLKHGFINWAWKVEEIRRFVDAFDEPYPGASTFCDEKRLFIKSVREDFSFPRFHPFMAGMVVRKPPLGLFVACSDGGLFVGEVYDEKGNNVTQKIRLGSRFTTPARFLQEALEFQAVYDSEGLKGT